MVSIYVVNCEELSFELPDKERMCFHEVLRAGAEAFIEYQVSLLKQFYMD